MGLGGMFFSGSKYLQKQGVQGSLGSVSLFLVLKNVNDFPPPIFFDRENELHVFLNKNQMGIWEGRCDNTAFQDT